MGQIGFYFDQVRCTGCHTCAVSCKDWHDVPAGSAKWLRIAKKEEGRFPDLFISYLVMPCYHCADPLCSMVCPNEAISKRVEDGIVVVDGEKCRGNKACGLIPSPVDGFSYGQVQAPCKITCPAHLDIPAYAALIAHGKFTEALDVIRRSMPLPSVCGRICMHPCETVCRRKEVEEPVAIMALKRFAADTVPIQMPAPVTRSQKDKVAIIGSGPAGLAAAYDLVRAGYGVTVFEADQIAGGMLATGVSHHRLPPEALQKDIDHIRALGVEIRTRTRIDLAGGVRDLLARDGYGAVLLALGACLGQKPAIAGAKLNGTTTGITFMQNVNLGNLPEIGKRVVVIGGGNVAVDCARAARRLQASKVHTVYLESEDEAPADSIEVIRAKEEGIIFHGSSSVVRIRGKAGKVVGADFVRITDLRFMDGQPQFRVQENSRYSLAADTVIFAIGQRPDTVGLQSGSGVECGKDGIIVTDVDTMMTGRSGVFAAGDAATGPSNVIAAVASGQKAAFYIDRYLQGEVHRVRPVQEVKESEIRVSIPSGIQRQLRRTSSVLPVAERLVSFREVVSCLTEEAAIAEAKRCLNCAGHLCKDTCPYQAPQFTDEENARMQKCDLCLDRLEQRKQTVCVEACPIYALDVGLLEELKKKYRSGLDAYGLERPDNLKLSAVFKAKNRNK